MEKIWKNLHKLLHGFFKVEEIICIKIEGTDPFKVKIQMSDPGHFFPEFNLQNL